MRAVLSGLAISLLTHAAIAAQVRDDGDPLNVVARVAALQPSWEARVNAPPAADVAPTGAVLVQAAARLEEATLHAEAPPKPAPAPKAPLLVSSRPTDVGPAVSPKRAPEPRRERAGRPARPSKASPEAERETTSVTPPVAPALDATSRSAARHAPADSADTGEAPRAAAAVAPGPSFDAEPGQLQPAGGSDVPSDRGPKATDGEGASDVAGTPSASRAERLARVAEARGRVERGLRYPKAARRLGLEGEVLVRCRPEAGRWDVAVARSSGVEHFDREALRATREAVVDLPASGDGFVLPVRFRLVDAGGLAEHRDG